MDDINVPQLEVLASLQSQLGLGLALSALQTENDLLGGFGLLVEDRLGLTTVTALLPVVTTLTLGEKGSLYKSQWFVRLGDLLRISNLSGLVLGDLVLTVAFACALAVSASSLWDVDLERDRSAYVQYWWCATNALPSTSPIKQATRYDEMFHVLYWCMILVRCELDCVGVSESIDLCEWSC